MTILLVASDLSLGRISKESLPQQAIMELLVEGVAFTSTIFRGKTSPDISEWLLCFNNAGDITEINWYGYRLGGSIALEWLPSTVHTVWFTQNNFEGTVNLESLPEIDGYQH